MTNYMGEVYRQINYSGIGKYFAFDFSGFVISVHRKFSLKHLMKINSNRKNTQTIQMRCRGRERDTVKRSLHSTQSIIMCIHLS